MKKYVVILLIIILRLELFIANIVSDICTYKFSYSNIIFNVSHRFTIAYDLLFLTGVTLKNV